MRMLTGAFVNRFCKRGFSFSSFPACSIGAGASPLMTSTPRVVCAAREARSLAPATDHHLLRTGAPAFPLSPAPLYSEKPSNTLNGLHLACLTAAGPSWGLFDRGRRGPIGFLDSVCEKTAKRKNRVQAWSFSPKTGGVLDCEKAGSGFGVCGGRQNRTPRKNGGCAS